MILTFQDKVIASGVTGETDEHYILSSGVMYQKSPDIKKVDIDLPDDREYLYVDNQLVPVEHPPVPEDFDANAHRVAYFKFADERTQRLMQAQDFVTDNQEQIAELVKYKMAIIAIPQQKTFPLEYTWPEKPSFLQSEQVVQ